jgi:hypothetical protein
MAAMFLMAMPVTNMVVAMPRSVSGASHEAHAESDGGARGYGPHLVLEPVLELIARVRARPHHCDHCDSDSRYHQISAHLPFLLFLELSQ